MKTHATLLPPRLRRNRLAQVLLPLTLALVGDARATLLFQDGFDYPPGVELGSGSSAANWENAKANITIAPGTLTYPGLASATGQRVNVDGGTANLDGTRTTSSAWAAQSNGTLYVSFLLRLDSSSGIGSTGTGTPIMNISRAGSASAQLISLNLLNSAGIRLGVLKYPSSSTPVSSVFFATGTGASLSADGSTTYLVVAKYEWLPGLADDVVTLWVNPATLGSGEDQSNKISTSSGTDGTSNAGRLYLNRGHTLSMDELRLGTTWADVTPTDGPVAQPQPRITQTLLLPGSMVLRGTNGTSNGVYQVLSAPDLTWPLGHWPALSTNVFDATGNFDSTNPVPPGAPQTFYRLRLGGQIAPPGVAPEITAPPTNQTVLAGQPAVFKVTATGSEPLRYQWFFNTVTALAGATNASLTISSAQVTDAGDYSVVVSNAAGAVTSAVATLTVESLPVILTEPASRNAVVGGSASFAVQALGSAPLHYQWFFNQSNLLAGATGATLTLTNLSTNDAGGYRVIVTNVLGAATSQVATLSVLQGLPSSAFNLYGFGRATTGGGVMAETNPGYVQVTDALGLVTALANKTGTIKVIEILNDLDLGYQEAGPAVQAFSIFREHNTPLLHPRLLQTGVSKIDVQGKNGLTIFSANGATLRHGSLNIKASSNLILRNLRFDEMWEWDESSKGNYDENDWDFITLGDGGGTVTDVWIDHCTFTKSYDGACDIKGGAHNITFSWCKYTGDDGASNPNSFVWQQIRALESNRTSHAMYDFLRTRGFSTTNIVEIIQGPQKTHLIGATADNAYAVTFHHQWFINTWDRLPRLRGGNVHNYNLWVDDVGALAVRRLRDTIAATLSPADQLTLNNTYNFKPFLNGSISTEGGAILVENSVYADNLTPLRNNQTDPNDPAYTGKIMALDSIYVFHNADATTTYYRGSSTNAPGDTLFGPVQAPVIPFAWNGFTSLPYSYPLDDPASLATILPSGAGAGLLAWPKENWLKVSY